MTLSVENKILRNVLDIESFARGRAVKLVKILDQAERAALAKLGTFKDTSTFSRRMMSITLTELGGTLADVSERYTNVLNKARREVLQMEYNAASKALANDLAKTTTAKVATRLSTGRLSTLLAAPFGGHTLSTWVTRQNSNLIRATRTELAKSLALNETVQQASKRLIEGFGVKRRAANTIAKTSLLQAGNDARDEMYRDNGQLIEGYQYVATLDARTCPICAPDDGRVEENREDLPELLRHPNCRCTIVPITPLSEDLTRPAVTDQDFRTVNHADGSTSTKTKIVSTKRTTQNFDQFFRSQPASWKRDWLGEERYALWRAGKLKSLEDLASNTRVLTVNQLKTRLGVDA